MIDVLKLADSFIKKQGNMRDLKPFHKYLISEFAIDLKKKLDNDSRVIIDNSPVTSKSEPTKETFTGYEGSKAPDNKIQVALITEDIGHLTGGRYYAWFIAIALCELGYEVTVYTNREPVFRDDFKEYKQPKVKIVCERARDLELIDVVADIYVGSPISGNVAAARLGKRYSRPAFDLIFDPFPMMEQYLGKRSYIGWETLLQTLRNTNTNIISLCNTTSAYIYEWLNKRKDQVFEIYPCVNSRERDKVKWNGKKEDYVVFISRLVKHKNFDHVLQAIKENNIKLKVISSVDGIDAVGLVKKMKLSNQVDFHFKVNDLEKFEIIYKSRGVINGATFEGFGMWAIEALSCGVPVICYEYPTIKEIKESVNSKSVYFAKWDDKKSLGGALAKALQDDKKIEPVKDFDFDAMLEKVRKTFTMEPKIGVVTIALNEEKYIEASLKSVIRHPNVKKVAVVEGAVNLFKHAASADGLSLDNTEKEVNKAKSGANGNKIVYERYGWANDKSELRNRALTLLGNGIDYVLVVDADEVWKQEDLDRLVEAFKQNPQTGVFLFPFYHFWKQKDLIAVGSQWDTMLFRCFKYQDKTLHWDRHETPVVNEKGRFIHKTNGSVVLPDVHVYHYGYAKEIQRVQEKLEYYKKRDTQLNVVDRFTNWKKGDETQSTHGGGTVEKFNGKHPDEVKGII